MPNMDLTEIITVVDRSGSMSAIAQDMEGGYNAFIEDQKRLPGRCRLTQVQFDNIVETVYSGVDIHVAPKLDLQPRNTTALFDAIGKTINEVGRRLSYTPEHERPGRVLFVIITDGKENASQVFSQRTIANMIQHQTDRYSWKFVFLGANQDSFGTAAALNITTANNFVADAAGVGIMMQNFSSGSAGYRSHGNYEVINIVPTVTPNIKTEQ